MNEVALRSRRINIIDTALLTDLSVLALLWCISIIIVNPVGNFPIIDDEFYERSVRSLLETGSYSPPEANMTFITNLLWGALFCLPSGVSFTALRFSTLFASLLGLFGTYILVRDLGQPRWLCWVATLTLAFTPAYYALSHSFMTDVPFTVVCVWAAIFFARSLRSESVFGIVIGTLLAVVATLSRQIGMAIPLAFAVAMVLKRGTTWQTMLRAVSPIGLCLIAFLGFDHFLAASGRLPATRDLYTNVAISTFTHSQTLFTTPISNFYCTVVYLGLFLLPVLLCTMGYVFRSVTKGTWAIAAAGAGILIVAAAVRTYCGWSDFMPLPEGHVLRPTGIGLPWLRGVNHLPPLPEAFWVCVTILAFVGTALFILHLSMWVPSAVRSLLHRNPMSEAAKSETETEIVTLFLLACGFILAVPYIGIRSTDRYLLPCVPFLAAGMVGFWTGSSPTATSEVGQPLRYWLRYGPAGLLAALGIFSVVGTRDYLAWHRVSLEASRNLMETNHVPAESIDGGIEFDFMYPAPSSREEVVDKVKKLEKARPQYFFTEQIRKQYGILVGLGWRPASPEYLVAFGPVPGYRVIREYAYDNWMPPRVRKIVALQRE